MIADALSLAAIQPEGAIAAESVRAEVKAAVREGARSAGRELVETAAVPAGKAAVRRATAENLRRLGSTGTGSAAGTLVDRQNRPAAQNEVLRQIPEALPRLTLDQITEMARPLAAKAGIRLSAWKPIRLLKDGTEVILSIPPQRGLKYLSAQAIQAGVGVVGFQKMEEHLASKRPQTPR